ncbi:MAG: NAD(P)H-hydrate dehydratase [Acidimicrobiales bacterium]
MIPVLEPDELRALDAAAAASTGELIERAGAAVARAALLLLGGGYGRRVVVVAGKGNNGADGRAAARRLRRRGMRVTVIEAAGAPARLPPCDLVVDAAYGTGGRGDYRAPDPGSTPVLAVDIPSGLDPLTGEAADGTVRATATVTFAALKPGLLFGQGPERAGAVEVADIGLDTGGAFAHLVTDADVAAHLPPRSRDAHKWNAAVFVVAGSPGLMGAPVLVARAALAAGAGMVHLGVPGAPLESQPAGAEFVGVPLPAEDWAAATLARASRFRAIVVGPGIGRSPELAREVRRLVDRVRVPLVLDADALVELDKTTSKTVLTPHDGEFERLTGNRPGPDRLAAARFLARRTGAVVLLKGPTTVVAEPGGEVLLVTSGSARLATAGTGDVLAGLIGAFLAQGVPPLPAAALAAHTAGAAARLGPGRGLVAGDLLGLVPRWLSTISGE